jgi:hypothetical protein
MAVEVAPEQKLPMNSPEVGPDLSPISLPDDSSMPPCDQETEWQPNVKMAAKESVQHMMSAVTLPSLLSSPDWGGETLGQSTPIQDRVVKIVLVE